MAKSTPIEPVLVMPSFWRDVEGYLKVGRLLHLIACLCLCFFIFPLKWGMLCWEEGNGLMAGFYGWLSSFFFANAILAELDVRSRWQNYKKLKDHLYVYGFQERLLRPLMNSSCQREAALLAAEHLGYKSQTQDFFYRQGYRWYHILPDFVFTHPWFLLSRYFWLSTFFVPTYTSKYF